MNPDSWVAAGVKSWYCSRDYSADSAAQPKMCRPYALVPSVPYALVPSVQDIRKSNLRENLGFPFIYFAQIVAGRLANSETWLRTVYRVGFAFVAPGFISHFPCDYERKLRQQLENKQSDGR